MSMIGTLDLVRGKPGALQLSGGCRVHKLSAISFLMSQKQIHTTVTEN